jgi:hypothetical protein
VAHTYNPSYSGGSWFEPSPGKNFLRPYLKNHFTKNRVGGVAQGEGLFMPKFCKKKKKEIYKV